MLVHALNANIFIPETCEIAFIDFIKILMKAAVVGFIENIKNCKYISDFYLCVRQLYVLFITMFLQINVSWMFKF